MKVINPYLIMGSVALLNPSKTIEDYKIGLLDSYNNLLIKSCDDYDQINAVKLRLFCHYYARYLLPTTELISFLKPFIEGKEALEIGAGCGDLGRALGIRMTDSFLQEKPNIKRFYEKTMQQPTIKYGTDVIKIAALPAIKKYKPTLVIGGWVSQWCDPHLPFSPLGGNIHGIKEDEVLDLVDTYIMIGSELIHGGKNILKRPHRTIDGRGIVRSRVKDNKIWIWEK